MVSGYPSSTVAGVSHNFTVTAQDAFGNTATGYTGTVSFTSSDSQAVLPANYTFVSGDGGVHSFTATLKTAGTQSITATDAVTAAITGTEAGIAVNSGAGLHFDFGTATSPLASGYTQMTESTTYSPSQGYGWSSGTISSRDRGTGGALDEDFNFTTQGTFAVDLANGTYNVTLTIGDAFYTQQSEGIFFQGVQVDTVTSPAGQYLVKTYTVTVANGRLDLGIKGLSSLDYNARINGLDIIPATPPPPPPPSTVPMHFDFGTATSPVASGYTQVTESTVYSSSQGYGWSSGTIYSRDRGTGGPLDEDFNFTTQGTFAVDLANGTYNVTLTIGDALYAQQSEGIFFQGVQVDTVTSPAGQFLVKTYSVTITNGQLDLGIQGLSSIDQNARINGLDIGAAPPPPTVPMHYDFGTATSPVASGYTQVTESTVYSSSQGYGWSSGTISSRDRGSGGALDEDFNFTTKGTFAVDLANGTYNVTVTIGDALYAQQSEGIFFQGVQVDTVTSPAGQFLVKTYTVTVANGQLDLGIQGLSSLDSNARINGLDISPA
jgi:fibronectin type 3 domain-containing protein